MTRRSAQYVAGIAASIIIAAWLAYAIGAATFHQYADDLAYYTVRQLLLVGISIALALLFGVPAGIVLSRPAYARQAERFMQIFNIGNTIPSLAVLALALGIFGIGELPAIIALCLASLLPITRNTYEGMKNVAAPLCEAARGLGMTPWQALLRVELPNALPIIIGGVRTALAINVGTAPLAYLIGADSLGTLIFPGIYLNNPQLLILGASATALLALALDGGVAAGSRFILGRRGLRP